MKDKLIEIIRSVPISNTYPEYVEALADMLLDMASDIVKEIFEEVEEVISKEILRCELFFQASKDSTQKKFWEGGEDSIRDFAYWIAELKKKYIGKDTNVTTNTEEEK